MVFHDPSHGWIHFPFMKRLTDLQKQEVRWFLKIRLISHRKACQIRACTHRDINLSLFSNRLVKYFKKN